MGSPSLGLPQREPITPPPPQCQWPQKGGGNSAGGILYHRLLWGHCWPLRKLSASGGTARGTSHPLYIPQLALPAGSFKQVNFNGSGKMYLLCKQCKKQIPDRDSMVSHCLQKHLEIHLVCSQCWMRYSDPSKFHLHGRGIHNLLFY